jgi:hypothetical protein
MKASMFSRAIKKSMHAKPRVIFGTPQLFRNYPAAERRAAAAENLDIVAKGEFN